MKQSVKSLSEKKDAGVKLTWLTCYDYSTASVLNDSELDLILVGDSGGMVNLGYQDTVPVSMDEMLIMCKSVRRGAPDKLIVGDMPKGSYEASDYDAITNAMRFVKEGMCDAIKLEGGLRIATRAKAIVEAGIPVIGHVGLTPQTSAQFGGYRVVGKQSGDVEILHRDVESLEEAGVFAILLEATPRLVSKAITEKSASIIFGIGAGPDTNGQLLITHDLLGLYPNFRPKFAKCFVPEIVQDFVNEIHGTSDLVDYGRKTKNDGLRRLISLCVESYIDQVQAGQFPNDQFSY